MYRILGITSAGELALVKETPIKESQYNKNPSYHWHNLAFVTDCGQNGSLCTWEKSTLYNRLNGLCNESSTICQDKTQGRDGDSNIFIGNGYYEYLLDNNDNNWLAKINDHNWKYGIVNYTYDNIPFNGNEIYSIESQFDSNIDSTIGLMYISDYLYAYPGGNPITKENAMKSWLYNKYNIWFITEAPDSEVYNNVWTRADYFGYIIEADNDANNMVTPVFYLKSNITLNNATGSITDPYIITN